MPHQYYAILIDGAFSSGKTTFIETISHQTGWRVSANYSIFYGQIDLDENTHLRLYELGGSLRSLQLWTVLSGELGYLLGSICLINTLQPTTFRDALSRFYVLHAYLPLPLLLVAQPHSPQMIDLVWDLEALRIICHLAPDTPMIECNAQDRDSVKVALLTFLRIDHES
jgi:signal recognition particle receptor subunit beta